MDTLVVDPFYVDMYAHFGFPSQAEFLAAKHPTTWVDWERGAIGPADAYARFFADRRPVDADAFTAYLRSAYTFLPGVEGLLDDLASGGVPLHVLSNYTDLWREVEAAVGLGARWGVAWTAVSCMTGLRKPEPGAYTAAAAAAGVDPVDCLLVDDRPANVEAAIAAGFGGGVTAVKGGEIGNRFFPPPPWSLLLTDGRTRRALASAGLTPKALRAAGVVGVFDVATRRSRVAGGRAVYLLTPTPAAVAAIVADLRGGGGGWGDAGASGGLMASRRRRGDSGDGSGGGEELISQRGLYADVTVVWAFPPPAGLDRALATRSPVPTVVRRLAVAAVDYLSLREGVYSLGMADSYVGAAIAAAPPSRSAGPAGTRSWEAGVEAYVSAAVGGLLSVVTSLRGGVPLLRATPGGAAAGVAAALDGALRGLLAEDPALLGGREGLGGDRPVVLLVDRDWDVGGAALHGKSYRSCVVDVVGVDVHAVAVPGGEDGEVDRVASPVAAEGTATPSSPAGLKGGPSIHQLDERTDPFWAAHGEGPFWEVAAAVEEGLAAYTADVAALSSAPPSAVAAATVAADAAAPAGGGGGTVPASLSDALASLPALNARKATLDIHTRLASAVLAAVASRGLAGLADLEAAIAAAAASATAARQFLPAVVALLGVAPPSSAVAAAAVTVAATDAGTAPPVGVPTVVDKARLAVTYAGRFGHFLSDDEAGGLVDALQRAEEAELGRGGSDARGGPRLAAALERVLRLPPTPGVWVAADPAATSGSAAVDGGDGSIGGGGGGAVSRLGGALGGGASAAAAAALAATGDGPPGRKRAALRKLFGQVVSTGVAGLRTVAAGASGLVGADGRSAAGGGPLPLARLVQAVLAGRPAGSAPARAVTGGALGGRPTTGADVWESGWGDDDDNDSNLGGGGSDDDVAALAALVPGGVLATGGKFGPARRIDAAAAAAADAVEALAYYDPASPAGWPPPPGARGAAATRVVVCMVGGGGVVEAEAVTAAATAAGKGGVVLYGGTEVHAPEGYVRQLAAAASRLAEGGDG
ncbi:hypothetical protein MMPV_008687 [Pyropia vietnamensis]